MNNREVFEKQKSKVKNSEIPVMADASHSAAQGTRMKVLKYRHPDTANKG
jgi:hypothetical protein